LRDDVSYDKPLLLALGLDMVAMAPKYFGRRLRTISLLAQNSDELRRGFISSIAP
jgi:hypothetical protein